MAALAVPAREGDLALTMQRFFDHANIVVIYAIYAISLNLLFDPGHNLDERILAEQFGF